MQIQVPEDDNDDDQQEEEQYTAEQTASTQKKKEMQQMKKDDEDELYAVGLAYSDGYNPPRKQRKMYYTGYHQSHLILKQTH